MRCATCTSTASRTATSSSRTFSSRKRSALPLAALVTLAARFTARLHRRQEVAHLADFESVRAPNGASAGGRAAPTRGASKSAAGAATARYLAPEMRATPQCAKPTAASDMYAYGVCALLACCGGEDYRFGAPPDEQLLPDWSRPGAASKGGEHLPTLLEGLLDLSQPPATSPAEALQRRMSAAEVLRHPFLDTEAERAAARVARQEAEATQRAVQWEAAERQRRLDEQQRAVERSEAAARQEAHRLAAANAALEKNKVDTQRQASRAAEEARASQARQAAAEAAARQASAQLAQEQAQLNRLKAEERAWISKAPENRLWQELAGDCATEAGVDAFFRQRQPNGHLQVVSKVRVMNAKALRAFVTAGALHFEPFNAHQKGDALLFHGCSQEAATNIQTEGLQLRFAAHGMLGQGLYGAPDPNKSRGYCKGGANGNFMFICRFNLSDARHAGPGTQHRNTHYEEFCIYDEARVVVLWMLKVSP